MFIAVLFVIAPNQKKPEDLTTAKWIYYGISSTTEYHLAINGNKLSKYTTTLVNLKIINLNERSQALKKKKKRSTYHMILVTEIK